MKTIKKYWASVVMAALSVFFGVITVMMGESFYETITEEVSNPMFRLTWVDAGVYAAMTVLWLAAVIDTAVAAYVSVRECKRNK